MQSPTAVSAFRTMADDSFRRAEDGQDLLEYGLLMALVAVVAMGAVATLGNAVTTIFWTSIANNF